MVKVISHGDVNNDLGPIKVTISNPIKTNVSNSIKTKKTRKILIICQTNIV